MTDRINLNPLQIAGTPGMITPPPATAQPSPCACPDAALVAALDAIASLEGADLEAVLAVAEMSRPGVRIALRNAFETEAHRYERLSRSAFAAAGRLAADPTAQTSTEAKGAIDLDREQNANISGDLATFRAVEYAFKPKDRISVLNDAFRRSFSGGKVVLSAGFAALPSVARAALLAAVRGFDQFDADNDPQGEHDFGMVKLAGYRCCWKIDCYDLRLRFASADPADPAVTSRVLTVMLAEEY